MDTAVFGSHPDWVLGVNDPNLIGWLTTVAYLLVAALCSATGRVVLRERIRHRPWEPVFWFGLAFVLTALGFNKQLDLQTPFLGLSRHLALAEGWYGERRIVQWTFLSSVMAVAGCVLVWTFWKLRRCWRHYWLAYVGILLILGFVLIRASPIHLEVNGLPWLNGLPVSKRHIMELAGIGCIAITGLLSFCRARESKG